MPKFSPKARFQQLSKSKIGLDGHDHVSDAAAKIFRACLSAMLEFEDGARLGQDSEFVHQMRLGSRKLQVVAANMGKYFLPKDTFARLLNSIRRTSHHLGAVRDLDVFIELLKEKLPPAEEMTPPEVAELDLLLKKLTTMRHQNVIALIQWFESDQFRALAALVRPQADVLHPEDGAAAALAKAEKHPRGPRFSHELPIILYRCYANAIGYAAAHSHHAPAGLPADDAHLHVLRIRLKHLRYMLDASKEVLGEEAKEFMKEAKALQDLIGAVHDPQVEMEMIQKFTKEDPSFRVNSLFENRLFPMLRANISKRREELVPAWEHFRSFDVKKLLGLAIAAL